MHGGPARAELGSVLQRSSFGAAAPSLPPPGTCAVQRGAIRIDGAHFKAYCNGAFAYSKVGLYARAVDSYTDALRIDPSSANAHHNRGALSADRLQRLPLCEPEPAQVASAQAGTAQAGTAHVGTAQVGAAQAGTAQVGTAQVGTA